MRRGGNWVFENYLALFAIKDRIIKLAGYGSFLSITGNGSQSRNGD
jgi:hypothetical protein